MAKYSKWIGGALGWAFGGPIGGILGFVFGSFVDGMQTSERPEGQRTLAGDFSASLLVLCASVMKADGKVLKSELDYVRDFFVRQFGPAKAQQDMLILREILKQDINLHEVTNQIRHFMSHPERLQLMHFLFGVALADGAASAQEVNMLETISRYLGISTNDFLSLKSMFVKDTGSSYRILEISPEATDEELKKAYKRMAMKHHPDKVAHLGEEVRKAAEEKLREVNNAYESIKKERGLV